MENKPTISASLAAPGQRLLARIVDTLVVGLPVIIVLRELVSEETMEVVAPPALAGCMLVYEALQLAFWGRTLGKRFVFIEVVLALPDGQDPGPEAAQAAETVPVGERAPLGVLRAVLRAAVYSVPIALSPTVLSPVAGIFWVVNAALLYEGTRRQALHDRVAGTVVKLRPPDSPAF